jgi:uncharacterized protein (DUF488 family)
VPWISREARRSEKEIVTIFTVGHSNHSIERFLELLQQQAIEELADIRRFPGSRKHPHFNREELQTSLNARCIRYFWMEALGGRRKAAPKVASENAAWRNASFRNYADYMGTDEFRRGIETLVEVATSVRTAMMCAEGLWWQCHRRLVSDFLLAQGHQVEHIMPSGQLKPHALSPGAVVADGRVTYPAPKSLFDGE